MLFVGQAEIHITDTLKTFTDQCVHQNCNLNLNAICTQKLTTCSRTHRDVCFSPESYEDGSELAVLSYIYLWDVFESGLVWPFCLQAYFQLQIYGPPPSGLWKTYNSHIRLRPPSAPAFHVKVMSRTFYYLSHTLTHSQVHTHSDSDRSFWSVCVWPSIGMSAAILLESLEAAVQAGIDGGDNKLLPLGRPHGTLTPWVNHGSLRVSVARENSPLRCSWTPPPARYMFLTFFDLVSLTFFIWKMKSSFFFD